MHSAQRTPRALLLAVDRQQSPLSEASNRLAFTPYGERSAQRPPQGQLGFNGQRRELASGMYLLGNGHRAYNPVLMRFHSADALSPFGRGGLNGYAYCEGDPVNFVDPSAKVRIPRLAMTGAGNVDAPLTQVIVAPGSGARDSSTTPAPQVSTSALNTTQTVATNVNSGLTVFNTAMIEGAPANPPGGLAHVANVLVFNGSAVAIGGRLSETPGVALAGTLAITTGFAIRAGLAIQRSRATGGTGFGYTFARGVYRASGAGDVVDWIKAYARQEPSYTVKV